MKYVQNISLYGERQEYDIQQLVKLSEGVNSKNLDRLIAQEVEFSKIKKAKPQDINIDLDSSDEFDEEILAAGKYDFAQSVSENVIIVDTKLNKLNTRKQREKNNQLILEDKARFAKPLYHNDGIVGIDSDTHMYSFAISLMQCFMPMKPLKEFFANKYFEKQMNANKRRNYPEGYKKYQCHKLLHHFYRDVYSVEKAEHPTK